MFVLKKLVSRVALTVFQTTILAITVPPPRKPAVAQPPAAALEVGILAVELLPVAVLVVVIPVVELLQVAVLVVAALAAGLLQVAVLATGGWCGS